MKKKVLFISVFVIAASLVLTGCGSTDVVASSAVTSFEAMANNEAVQSQTSDIGDVSYWRLQASEAAVFVLGKSAEADLDIAIEVDATPFINAGLNPSLLSEDRYSFDPTTNRLSVISNLGDTQLDGAPGDTIEKTFEQWVKGYRKSIGYHAPMDHFGISLGDGNMLEWAKTLETNDKDLVFVLNPEPLIQAGVDPAKLETWVFGEVEVMDEAGKAVMVEKFLMVYSFD